ncbi:hypothetical protein ACH4SP_15825 [Streptomyces sp. NPDC021093]|uniref:hypothetical protein n=1 Tax=Streptomyces sp. NPDC021093 TaxID=3365112 RepID=UPI0037B8423E
MPRGRHRHSPPLHKLLPSSAVAGVSLVCAVGAWFVAEPVVLRSLVAAAAAAAVTGATLMRSWDRRAGLKVAELTRAREADVWKAEERVADIEGDLEESRALRVRLDAKLRAKRVELAGLRNEHAALLRRYATAETERATALERRRQLALEAAAKTAPKTAPKELPAAASTPTPAAYMRAAAALENLGRNRAVQRERAEAAETAAASTTALEVHVPAQAPARVDAQSAEALVPTPAPTPAPVPVPAPDLREHTRASAALAPYAPQNLPAVRKQGGFDFFGTGTGTGAGGKAPASAPAPAPAASAPATDASALEPVRDSVQQQAVQHVQHEDLADVVGEEALADHHRASLAAAGRDAVGEVIDLTAHDETEQLDVADLRSAISS